MKIFGLVDGMRVFCPATKRPNDLASRARAATGADGAEINFRDCGLVPAARLNRVRAEPVAR
jgi:hypothetical protein